MSGCHASSYAQAGDPLFSLPVHKISGGLTFKAGGRWMGVHGCDFLHALACHHLILGFGTQYKLPRRTQDCLCCCSLLCVYYAVTAHAAFQAHTQTLSQRAFCSVHHLDHLSTTISTIIIAGWVTLPHWDGGLWPHAFRLRQTASQAIDFILQNLRCLCGRPLGYCCSA